MIEIILEVTHTDFYLHLPIGLFPLECCSLSEILVLITS